MTDRLKGILRGTQRTLASSTLATAAIASAMAALLVWVLPFILYGVPGMQIESILYDGLFGKVILAGLAVSTFACTLPRFARIVRRASRVPEPGRPVRLVGQPYEVHVPFEARHASAALRSCGFRSVVIGDGWCWGVKRRWALLGSLIFHTALLLIAAGALVAAVGPGRFSGQFLLTEGQELAIDEDAYFDDEGGPAPELGVALEDIEARFHEDVLLFTGLESKLRGDDGRVRTVGVGHPWWLDTQTTVALTNFGWALQVDQSRSATEPLSGLENLPSGEATASQVFNLRAFPPGSTDEFVYAVGPQKYRFVVRVYGDYVERDGIPGAKSFNASNPAAVVSVWLTQSNGEEKLVVDSRVVPLPGSFRVGAYTVELGELLEYGEYRVSRAPGALLFLLGIAMLLAGTVLRLVFYRVEVVLAPSANGTGLYARADVYRDDPGTVRRLSQALTPGRSGPSVEDDS